MTKRYAHIDKNKGKDCYQGVFLKEADFKKLIQDKTPYVICPDCNKGVVKKKAAKKPAKKKAKKAAKKQ